MDEIVAVDLQEVAALESPFVDEGNLCHRLHTAKDAACADAVKEVWGLFMLVEDNLVAFALVGLQTIIRLPLMDVLDSPAFEPLCFGRRWADCLPLIGGSRNARDVD